MLQMCLDFYSPVLVETPEYANPGNDIQMGIANNGYTSEHDDQPTYQGLLNDNSEFLSIIISSCAWHTTDFLELNLDCKERKIIITRIKINFFFLNLALACLHSRCLKVIWAQESTGRTKKPAFFIIFYI